MLGGGIMRNKKFHIYLSDFEYHHIINSLNLENTISDKMMEVIQGKEGNQFAGILKHKEGVDLLT